MTFIKRLFGLGTQNMSVEEFMRHIVKAHRKLWPDAQVEILRDTTNGIPELRVSWQKGGNYYQLLENAYAEYRRHPDKLSNIVCVLQNSIWSQRALSAPLMFEAYSANILPLIKNINWLNDTLARLRTLEARKDVPIEITDEHYPISPLTDDLLIAYVIDQPDSMAYQTPEPLYAFDMDLPALHALALDNLRGWLPSADIIHQGDWYEVDLDDIYDASLVLLLAEWIDQLALAAPPLIAIPTRADLAICDSSNIEASRKLEAWAQQRFNEGPYAISPYLYGWKDGVFTPVQTAS